MNWTIRIYSEMLAKNILIESWTKIMKKKRKNSVRSENNNYLLLNLFLYELKIFRLFKLESFLEKLFKIWNKFETVRNVETIISLYKRVMNTANFSLVIILQLNE